jgi:hypothetical protein
LKILEKCKKKKQVVVEDLQAHKIMGETTLELQDKACHYFVKFEGISINGPKNIEDNGFRGG